MDAKRGYVPEDARNFAPEALETMRRASRHICYLIDEGYDLKSASTFVGNHFLLSERQRLAVVRSIDPKEVLAARKAKELETVSGGEVWIDGFNTIITLEVLLSDSVLLTCMDGTIRDLASLRGTYRIIPETEQAVRMLFETLQEMHVETAHILLDEPVSNSGRLKTRIAEIGEGYRVRPDIRILRDVDRALWDCANVITSDSIILDHCISWVNLMKHCLKKHPTGTYRVWE